MRFSTLVNLFCLGVPVPKTLLKFRFFSFHQSSALRPKPPSGKPAGLIPRYAWHALSVSVPGRPRSGSSACCRRLACWYSKHLADRAGAGDLWAFFYWLEVFVRAGDDQPSFSVQEALVFQLTAMVATGVPWGPTAGKLRSLHVDSFCPRGRAVIDTRGGTLRWSSYR